MASINARAAVVESPNAAFRLQQVEIDAPVATYWPDFDETELDRAFRVYAQRDRRFGGVKPEAATTAGSPDAA